MDPPVEKPPIAEPYPGEAGNYPSQQQGIYPPPYSTTDKPRQQPMQMQQPMMQQPMMQQPMQMQQPMMQQPMMQQPMMQQPMQMQQQPVMQQPMQMQNQQTHTDVKVSIAAPTTVVTTAKSYGNNALIFAIGMSLLYFFCGCWYGLICSLAGVFFAFSASSSSDEESGKRYNKISIGCSSASFIFIIVSVVITIISVVATVAAGASSAASSVSSVSSSSRDSSYYG